MLVTGNGPVNSVVGLGDRQSRQRGNDVSGSQVVKKGAVGHDVKSRAGEALQVVWAVPD